MDNEDYTIVDAGSGEGAYVAMARLISKVNRKKAKGWLPIGGVATLMESGYCWLFQAMVKPFCTAQEAIEEGVARSIPV